MSKKNATIGLIISIAVIVAVSIASAVIAVDFVRDVIIAPDRAIVQSGDIVVVDESRLHRIFVEAERLPPIGRHDFTLTNTVNGNVFHSRPVSGLSSFNYNNLVDIGEDGTRRFVSGTAVADINLEPGTYVIEFAPLPFGVDIVWDYNIFGDIMGTTTSFVVWVSVLSALSTIALAGIIVFAIKMAQAKKHERSV